MIFRCKSAATFLHVSLSPGSPLIPFGPWDPDVPDGPTGPRLPGGPGGPLSPDSVDPPHVRRTWLVVAALLMVSRTTKRMKNVYISQYAAVDYT